MKVVMFTHSVVSCWNHGNAHFQRGILRALAARGHQAVALEPVGGWSRSNLAEAIGEDPAPGFARRFPDIDRIDYRGFEEIEAALDGAGLVLVHEWTDPALVRRLGRMRARGAPFLLLFHDTHHRAVSAPEEMAALDLNGYDGVLAFGAVLAETWRRHGWADQVHVWHEAADLTLFKPHPQIPRSRDLVWIGNWGDGERGAELDEFLVEPVRALGLSATVHGVRYPEPARVALARAGIDQPGWIANADVPEAFARHRMTIHVPRRFYARELPGIPTIRMFEALASGIPLISAPWEDSEGLFRTGTDYLRVEDGPAMRRAMRAVLDDPAMARELARNGRETILARHGCEHRVDELFRIVDRMTAGHAPHSGHVTSVEAETVSS